MRAWVIAICVLVAVVGPSCWWANRDAQATSGWGVRVVSQQQAPKGQQVMTLWAVQTPSGVHACATANYGSGGSSNRPIWLSCDWGK